MCSCGLSGCGLSMQVTFTSAIVKPPLLGRLRQRNLSVRWTLALTLPVCSGSLAMSITQMYTSAVQTYTLGILGVSLANTFVKLTSTAAPGRIGPMGSDG